MRFRAKQPLGLLYGGTSSAGISSTLARRNLRHEFLTVRGRGVGEEAAEFIVEPRFREHFYIPHPTGKTRRNCCLTVQRVAARFLHARLDALTVLDTWSSTLVALSPLPHSPARKQTHAHRRVHGDARGCPGRVRGHQRPPGAHCAGTGYGWLYGGKVELSGFPGMGNPSRRHANAGDALPWPPAPSLPSTAT